MAVKRRLCDGTRAPRVRGRSALLHRNPPPRHPPRHTAGRQVPTIAPVKSRLPARLPLWAACLLVLATGATAAPDPKASRLYEDALSRYEKRDLPGAVIQLRNALQIDRNQLPVHMLMGKALAEQGDVIGAEVAFNEALRLGVNRAEVVVPLARVLIGLGRSQEVLSHERFTTSGLPPATLYELQLVRAAAATDIGDFRTAQRAVEEARAINGADAAGWVAEVPVRMRQRQVKEALAAADRAVALAPGLADAHYVRAEALHVAANLKEAAAAYDKCLSIKPDHVEALVARAGLLMDQGRDADAARDLQEVIRLSPKEPRARYLSAVIADRQGRTEQAKAALNEVTSLLDPVPMQYLRYRPQILMLGGMAHHGLRQGEKARPYLEAVLRVQPEHPVAKVLASIHFGDRNFDRGIEVLESYLRSNPGDTQAMLQLASAHMGQGRHARATQILQEALRQGDPPKLRTALGLSLVGRGEYADGIKELEAVVAKDPGQLTAGITLAGLYMKSERPRQAVKVAEALVQRHPSNPGAHNLLGVARRQAGDGNGARSAFDQAVRLDPSFSAAQLGLARLDMDSGANTTAIDRLNAVIARDPKNVEALLTLAVAGERSGQFDQARRWLETADDHAGPRHLDAAVALVDFLLRQGRPDAAREATKRASNKQPESVTTLLLQARVALALNDVSAARTSLTRASNASGNNPPQLTRIALLQLQARHLAGASYSIDKALQARPDYLPALAMRGDIDLRSGEFAKAEQLARQLIARQPRQGVGHGLLGDVAMARGQRDAAIESYRRAHEIDRSSDSLLRLFRATHGRDPAAAVRLAEAWLKQHPRDSIALRGLADAHLDSKRFAAARAAYDALLALTPRDADAINNLAYAQVALKDPAAMATAERALAENPNAPHIIGTAGWAAFQSGQKDRAIQLLRDARLRDPSNLDTRYFLGTVLASTGRTSEAREELAYAVNSPTRFTNRAAAEQLLATLR